MATETNKEKRINVRMTDDEFNIFQEGLNEYNKQNPDKPKNQTTYANWCFALGASKLKIGDYNIKQWVKDEVDVNTDIMEANKSKRDVDMLYELRTIKNLVLLDLIKGDTSLKRLAGDFKEDYGSLPADKRHIIPVEFIDITPNSTETECIEMTRKYLANKTFDSGMLELAEAITEKKYVKADEQEKETTEEEDKQFYQENKQ